MAKAIIYILLVLLCLFFLSFAMFNDNPKPRPEVGDMSYMMRVTGFGVLLCLGALFWLHTRRPREP